MIDTVQPDNNFVEYESQCQSETEASRLKNRFSSMKTNDSTYSDKQKHLVQLSGVDEYETKRIKFLED